MRDVARTLVLDRFNRERRRNSQLAGAYCRTLAFHARAKIRQEELQDMLQRLGNRVIEQVVLPGPSVDLGGVGSQTSYHVLGSLVQVLQPEVILETGTYLGVSALTMALNAPPTCQIFTLDLPDETSADEVPGLNVIDQMYITESRHRVGEAFIHYRSMRNRIVQIRGDSMTFRAEEEMHDVDLIYIDGGHSLAVITKDTENAFRVLAPNGTIIWDDYFYLYPDVVAFLDKLTDQYVLHSVTGTNYVIYSRRWRWPAS